LQHFLFTLFRDGELGFGSNATPPASGQASPLRRGSPNPVVAQPAQSLLPETTSTTCTAASVSSLFGDDSDKPLKPTAAVSDLFKPDMFGSSAGARGAMFRSTDEEEASTEGQGSFAAALLEEDGGIRSVGPASAAQLSGLFSDPDEAAAPAGPTFGEVFLHIVWLFPVFGMA
jgi:hypothetical protein